MHLNVKNKTCQVNPIAKKMFPEDNDLIKILAKVVSRAFQKHGIHRPSEKPNAKILLLSMIAFAFCTFSITN